METHNKKNHSGFLSFFSFFPHLFLFLSSFFVPFSGVPYDIMNLQYAINHSGEKQRFVDENTKYRFFTEYRNFVVFIVVFVQLIYFFDFMNLLIRAKLRSKNLKIQVLTLLFIFSFHWVFFGV